MLHRVRGHNCCGACRINGSVRKWTSIPAIYGVVLLPPLHANE
jgi:hypothetical protein